MNLWKRAGKRELPWAEAFLRKREAFCVGAAFRFLHRTKADYLWTGRNGIPAFLIYTHRTLYPVFDVPADLSVPADFSASPDLSKKICKENKRAEPFFSDGVPLPPFFGLLQGKAPLHAMQGLAACMDMLEAALIRKGFFASEKYDYELRSLVSTKDGTLVSAKDGTIVSTKDGTIVSADGIPEFFTERFPAGPPGLVIREPFIEDIDGLFPLQQGYETEEVLPAGGVFSPAACRKSLEHLIAGGMILAAELEGKLVGKINVNAQSFTRLQIGGVYVLPEYRSRGIAQAMTAALVQKLLPQKKQFTLFVKKANAPARRVYDKTGFAKIADYRINYYLQKG